MNNIKKPKSLKLIVGSILGNAVKNIRLTTNNTKLIIANVLNLISLNAVYVPNKKI